MATVGQLLNLDYKKRSLTISELRTALNLALSIPAIANSPPVRDALTTVDGAITAYDAVVTIINGIRQVTPTIRKATKMAAIPLNPAISSEVAQDTLQEAQASAINGAKQGLENAKNSFLDMEVPGTEAV